jgi:hypothetical protein
VFLKEYHNLQHMKENASQAAAFFSFSQAIQQDVQGLARASGAGAAGWANKPVS